jgi:hypothetical protein
MKSAEPPCEMLFGKKAGYSVGFDGEYSITNGERFWEGESRIGRANLLVSRHVFIFMGEPEFRVFVCMFSAQFAHLSDRG